CLHAACSDIEAKKNRRCHSANSEEELDRELVESFVCVALLTHTLKIELLVLDRLAVFLPCNARTWGGTALPECREERLDLLVRVEIDVEELSRFDRLRNSLREIQSRDCIVRDFRIQPDHLGMIERINERQRMADRRQKDVATRLVWFWLQRKLVVVFLGDVV